jgi:hypothetical protein
MSKAKQKKNPNADLVAVVRNHRSSILEFYNQAADRRPVILLDLQRMKLHRYPFNEYRTMVRQSSQAILAKQYERAVAKNKVFVVVWDKATRRLVTMSFRRT